MSWKKGQWTQVPQNTRELQPGQQETDDNTGREGKTPKDVNVTHFFVGKYISLYSRICHTLNYIAPK